MEQKLLKNAEDFLWHKKELDVKSKREFVHRGTPDKYPCKVISSYYDDPNGPIYQEHEFIYQQEVTCTECGHKTLIWPE